MFQVWYKQDGEKQFEGIRSNKGKLIFKDYQEVDRRVRKIRAAGRVVIAPAPCMSSPNWPEFEWNSSVQTIAL